MRTTDGGSHFVGIPTPSVGPAEVHHLRYASRLDGYAFGPQLWSTTDGGSHWSSVHTPGKVTELEAAGGAVYALACVASSKHCHDMSLLRSRVGSSSWTRLHTPLALHFGARFALSGRSTLYVLPGVGGSATKPPELVSLDGGAHFLERDNPCQPALGGTPAAAVSGAAVVWEVCPTGTRATVKRSTNAARSWEATSGNFTNSVEVAPASAAVALAYPGPTSGTLDRTADGGSSYHVVLRVSGRLRWVGYSTTKRAYAIAASGLGKDETPTKAALYESGRGGADGSWHKVGIG